MRTISADHSARLAAGHWRVRVSVKDAGGTYRDLTSVAGFNALKSVRWGENVDAPGMTADIELWRNLDAISFSPLHDSSPLNRAVPFDATAAVSALVDLNRQVKIEWALESDSTAASSWTLAFEGLVESFTLADGETMAIGARGQYAELQDRIFEEEFVFAFATGGLTGALRVWQPSTAYALNERVVPTDGKANGKWFTVSTAGTSGATEPTWPGAGTVANGTAVFTYSGTTSPTAGYAVTDLLTQMALAVVPAGSAVFGDSTSPGDIEVYQPSSPGWNLNVFQVKRESVWNAMQQLAQQIGWDLRWKWDPVEAAFRLHLYDPNRSKTTPDRVLSFGLEVRGYDDVSLDIANVRNVVRVVYSDSASLDAQNRARRRWVQVTDSTSLARFGRRFMEVAESSSSSIDSSGEATTMANAMLSDLASPVADVGVRLGFFPWIELTDLLGLPADGRRFTSQQNLAVTSYDHEWSEGRGSTKVAVRGKPSSGWYRWARISGAQQPDEVHRLLDRSNGGSNGLTAVANLRGQTLQLGESPILRALPREVDWHVSAVSGFTLSSATLKGSGRSNEVTVTGLKPGGTYYAKSVPKVWNQERLVEGQPSEETSFVAGYVEPVDLNPETVAQPLPPNGDFESWFDGGGSPPDHWAQAVGVWNTDVRQDNDAASAAYALKFGNTGISIRAEVRSAWFPIAAGRGYVLDYMLKRGAADGDVRATIEWGDSAKASLGTDTGITPTTGLSSWSRSRQLVVESPSGARFARVLVGRDVSGTYDFWIDAVSLRLTGEALSGPTYSDANWVDYGGGFTGGGYWRDAAGLIHLRGLVQTLVVRAVGATIFTLPAGFRPAAQELFAVNIGTVGTHGRVDIAAGGQVYIQTALAANDFVSLSGIVFDPR